jgi:cytoskeleton protein RodZ
MNPGSAWKEVREARGMTLDKAASALRVNRKFLQDIEEGDYAGWPERVFSSGYIRAYANLLSMDPEPVLTEYFHHLEKTTVDKPRAGYSLPSWAVKERERGSRKANYAIAAAVVLIVGLTLAWFNARTSSRRVPASPPVAVAPSAPAQDNAASGTGSDGADDSTQTAQPAGAIPPEASPSMRQGTVSAAGVAGPVRSPYQLFIEASEMTWLMYSIDEEEPVDVMLYPRDRVSIQARKKIFLKLGNAGGVIGTLNGKLLPPFGARGQVKEIRLGE